MSNSGSISGSISRRVTMSLAAAGMLAGAVSLLAQYQVNRQLYGNNGPNSSIRYSPQYLGGQPTGPSSARMLPSEVRHSYVTSGALPSEIRGGYARVGPLSPSGPVAYIPPPANYSRNVGSMPQGNYLNPQPMGSSPSVAASPWLSNNYGTVHNSSAPAAFPSSPAGTPRPGNYTPTNAVTPSPLSTPASTNPFRAAPMNGTVRYSQ